MYTLWFQLRSKGPLKKIGQSNSHLWMCMQAQEFITYRSVSVSWGRWWGRRQPLLLGNDPLLGV